MSNHVDAASFASAVQPIVADTLVVTDTRDLVAGMVSVPTSQGLLPAYRAAPQAAGTHPIVLVVQEIFGLHEHIRDVVRRLAKLGYFAIALDLYHRQGDVLQLPSIDAIRAVVATVPDAQVLADLDASLSWAEHNGGDGSRVAVTGFCWGGRITWLYAAHQPRLKAAVAWYGRLTGNTTPLAPRNVIDVIPELKCPVLGLYGGQDQGIPVDAVEQVRAALETQGGASTIHVYPDAPHAFYADYRPSYRREAAEDGFRRLRAWLEARGVS